MNQQHVDDLIDAYALGALEPDEVASVEAHLATCAHCQALLAAAKLTSTQLLYGVPLVTPPPALKASVLARVHAEATGAPANGQPHDAQYAPDAEQSTRKSPLHRFLDAIFGKETPNAADASAALLLNLLAAPDCKVWEVGGTDAAPAANARLFGTPNGRDAVLVTNGLKDLDADQAYQIWLLRDGKPQPYSLFRVSRGGQGRQAVRASARLSDFDVVAVTPEPATGSPGPTGPIVLMGQLSA